MSRLIGNDFLLDTPAARRLYHEYAEDQPIFDYHNHLSPRDIAEHRHFNDLAELWLETDHYKWRAMRANGVDERYITGDAEPYEKFEAWARVLPQLVGSPLYHWTHLELERYFGINDTLCPENAKLIWDETSELLKMDGFDAVSLLNKMDVRFICTTDDPIDDLKWHWMIAEDESIGFKVCPSFRPDRYLSKPDGEKASDLMRKYGADDLDSALERALDHFCENGCIISDHGPSLFQYRDDPGLAKRMRALGKAYNERGIVMQLHYGAIRNNSPKLSETIGADAGGDSVGKSANPYDIAAFLGDLEAEGNLPKTIIYNLDPADNTVFSTMAGNFAPRVQYGAAWWFNDTIRGIEAQIDELMETGALAASVGMLTDSRSFTSFVRHEYYRRILCRKIGRLVQEGMYPEDMDTLGGIVKRICYDNAAGFFEK